MAFTYPPAALDWLLDGCGSLVLVLADSLALPRLLARRGSLVVAVHKDAMRLRTGLGTPGIALAGARAEALPFGDCRFDAVLVHQVFPEVAPAMALPEFARVLKPEGCLLISHLGRDDSVPWVHRLAQLMQSVDPSAMTAPTAAEVMEPAMQSKYFHGSSRTFRHWEPVTRDALVAMAVGTAGTRRLDEASRLRLVDSVTGIYDQVAGNNQLRLPYQLGCWRGTVDHQELTRPIHMEQSGLIIRV